jgi:hypothetical protein
MSLYLSLAYLTRFFSDPFKSFEDGEAFYQGALGSELEALWGHPSNYQLPVWSRT